MDLKLKSINAVENDFTLNKLTFIIADTEESGNKQILSREILEEMAKTINNKPISTKYFKSTNSLILDDHLGTHEQKQGYDRDGNEVIVTDTYPIGHFVTDGYFGEYDGKEVLMADAVGYVEHFPDVFSLLQEWINDGIQVNSSCEYYYKNFQMIDGIEHIMSPVVLSRHVILNSEDRGNAKVVDGAYQDSQLLSINMKKSWNEMLAKDIELMSKSQNNKDGEHMAKTEMFKKVCELSHDDVRYAIYEELRKVQTADEYNNSWITEVYEDNFVLYFYDTETYMQVPYTKTETEVMVDYSSKVEVKSIRQWVVVTNELEQSINTLTEENETLKTSMNELETIKTEKAELEISFNEATEKLVSLNARVEELSEIEKYVNEEKLEKAINERKSHFETKFKAVNAIEKFESEEVQALIIKSIDDSEAMLSLNSMIVDMISAPVVEDVDAEIKDNGIKVLNSKKIGNLVPETLTLESKYFNE